METCIGSKTHLF